MQTNGKNQALPKGKASMQKGRMYTVKQLADISHVSVRTLHYYDETGLLTPAEVKLNGYRLYGNAELMRLQQILFFKELEFSLDQIKEIIDSPHFDQKEALRSHKKQLELKTKRLQKLIKTIDTTMNQTDKTKDVHDDASSMQPDDLFDSFDKKEMEAYQKEAKERWGNTDAWKQSQERTKHWKKEDYDRLKRDGEIYMQKVADAFKRNLALDSLEVMELMAEHRKGLHQFYDVSDEMHKNLADMYIADPRFTAYYEKYAEGLAKFMHDAIHVYCEKRIK